MGGAHGSNAFNLLISKLLYIACFGATSELAEFCLSKVQMPVISCITKAILFSALNPFTPHYQGSPPTPPFQDFQIVKRARLQLPRGSYSGRRHKQTDHEGQGQTRGLGGGRTKAQGGFHSPVRPPTGSLVAAINRLSLRRQRE